MTDKSGRPTGGCKVLHLLHKVAPYIRLWRVGARKGRGCGWSSEEKTCDPPILVPYVLYVFWMSLFGNNSKDTANRRPRFSAKLRPRFTLRP